MELAEIIEGVHKLSAEQLYEVREVIEKELKQKRILEIENTLKEAKKAASENKLKYYSSGEVFLSALNEE
jgi:hypothetical protein